jgi:hypothetical protein
LFDNIDAQSDSPEQDKPMNLEITDEEREFLDELLEEEQKHLIQQIDHTDTRQFEQMLKGKLALLESLKRRIEGTR